MIASRGVLYATADYAHGVQALSQTQIEERVAELIRPSRVAIGGSTSFARAACLMQNGVPQSIWIDATALCHALAGLGSEPSAEAVG